MGNKFPEDMRVLAVDDNTTCLTILEAMLITCKYKATTTTQVNKALDILREEKFDLVITEVDLTHHMEGFELLEQVRLEMGIPVIVLSSHDSKEMIMKGITEGASAYLLKPVRIEVIKNIWQHVIRRNLDIEVYNDSANKGSKEGMTDHENTVDHDNIAGKPNKKRKDHKEDPVDHDHEIKRQQYHDPIVPTQKKPRVVWTAELHQKFVAAVNHLGLDKAVPKRILEYMNDANITRENVASHLQKYRMHMKKLNDRLQAANMVSAYGQLDINTQFMGGGGCGQYSIETGYRHSYQPAAAAARLASVSQGGVTQWGGQASNLVDMTQMMMNQSQTYLPRGMPMPTPTLTRTSLDQFDNGQQYTTDITHTQMQEYLDASATAAHSTDDHNSESDAALNHVINGAAAIDYDFVNSINDLMLEENLSNNYAVNAQPEVEASVSENNGSSTEADQDSLFSDFSSKFSNYDISLYNGNWTSTTRVIHQSTSLCTHPSSDNMRIMSSSEFDLQRQQHSLSNHIVGNHMMNCSQIPAAACDQEFFSHQTNSLVVHPAADQANNNINMLDQSSGSFHLININGGHGFNFARESDNVQGPLATQPQDDNYG